MPVPRRTDPGAGTIESNDEAAWERGDGGVGTLERDDVANWDTGRLFEFAEHKRQRHQKAREARRGRGGRSTDTLEDDLMRGYLSDIRTIEDELYDRGVLG